MDYSKMTYEELTDELSRIKKLQGKTRLIMNTQCDGLNSYCLRKYREGYYRLLVFKASNIIFEIQRRADMIPFEVVFKHLK